MKTLRILVSLLLLTVALPVFAQSPGFEAKYQLAREQYAAGKYETARTTIRKALSNSPGISAAQRSKGQALVRDCDHAIAILNEIRPLRTSVDFPYGEQLDSIPCKAGQPKLLTATSEDPSICKVDHISGTTVYIKSVYNPNRTDRKTRIVLKMGNKAQTQYVTINQVGRPETHKYLEVTTVPSHAEVIVNNNNPGSSPFGIAVTHGPQRIRVKKSGYTAADTTFVLPDDNVEETIDVNIKLVPNFATVNVTVMPEEGFSFGDELPVVRINGRSINLSGREIYTYDDDRELRTYEVYQDGTIPVPPGEIEIFATATNFESARYNCRLKEGEADSTTLVLKAITGVLQLVDTGNARDAVVILDGKEVGTVEQLEHYVIGVGDHVLQLVKDGHIADQTNYAFTVKANEMTSLSVAMVPFQVFAFTSKPESALVYINEEYFGNTPTVPVVFKENEAREGVRVEVRLDGYMPSRRTIRPDFERRDTLTEHFDLTKVSALNVTTDASSLYLVVKTSRKETSPDSVLVNRLLLPTQINLPVRKKPYYVELRRGGSDAIAYKGNLKFTSENKRQHRIQSWSQNNFHLLSANVYLPGPLVNASAPMLSQPVAVGGYGNAREGSVNFQPLGDVSLFKFRVFPGFSTSVLHATALLQNGIISGEGLKNLMIDNKDNTGALEIEGLFMLPGMTCLFLNDEFRVGGAINDYMDVDVVGSYAWYPGFLKNIIPMSFFSGHEIFAGVELASRLPFVNATLRFGYQSFIKPEANIWAKNLGNDTKSQFRTYDLDMPGMLVLGLGFSVGGKDSKGDSIIRLF